MEKAGTLSLKEAVLININIMLGSGIFINTVVLSQNAQCYSGALYIINAILVLPLILSMAALMKVHPRGGFYVFGSQEISPFAGFISAWSYFIGKLASATLMLNTAFLLLQTIIPELKSINTLALDIIALVIFTALNLLRMKIGMAVQSTAFIFKLVPILFVIFSGILLTWSKYLIVPTSIMPILQSMPLVLFTALGFEATLSLSSHIREPEKNGPRAIIIAFALVTTLCFLFQTNFYLLLGSLFNTFPNFLSAFPALVQTVCTDSSYSIILTKLLHIAIASSALSGAYGILFSTHWNLYAVAQNNHLPFSAAIIQKNRYDMPTVCITVQMLLCFVYLLITQGSQLPLQLTASFGSIIAYTISICALIITQKKNPTLLPTWIGWCALFNCALFIASSSYTLFKTTALSFSLFISFMIVGTMLFATTRKVSEKYHSS